MSATHFCESSSFMVKNAVKVLYVVDNKHVQILCLHLHKNKIKYEGSEHFVQFFMLWRCQRDSKLDQIWSNIVINTCIKTSKYCVCNINLSFIKPFRDSPPRFEGRPEADVALPFQGDSLKEPEWELERILDIWISRGNCKFKVKWRGYPREEWIPLENMENAATLIVQFFAESEQPVPLDVQDFFLRLHAEFSQPEGETVEAESKE